MSRRFSSVVSCSVLTLALALSACGGSKHSNRVDSAESLLHAEGSWKVVEKDAETNPEVMHDTAKAGVNVHSMRKDLKYASQVKKDLKRDSNFRLLVLERQMQDVNYDLGKLMPDRKPKRYDSYASLGLPEPAPSKEETIENIIEKVKAEKTPVAKVVPKKVAYKQPTLSGPAAVKRLRMGQHPGKTRLVLDLNKKPSFSYDLDNSEKLLLVDISGARWDAAAKKSMAKHPLVAAYSTHDNGSGGTMLVLELKKPVKVTMSTAMKPNPKAGGYHRIVMDLAKL